MYIYIYLKRHWNSELQIDMLRLIQGKFDYAIDYTTDNDVPKDRYRTYIFQAKLDNDLVE